MTRPYLDIIKDFAQPGVIDQLPLNEWKDIPGKIEVAVDGGSLRASFDDNVLFAAQRPVYLQVFEQLAKFRGHSVTETLGIEAQRIGLDISGLSSQKDLVQAVADIHILHSLTVWNGVKIRQRIN